MATVIFWFWIDIPHRYVIPGSLWGRLAHKEYKIEYQIHLTLSSQVPDGSSVDISRVVRFDSGDDTYLNLAYDAYKQWSTNPKYKDIFFPSSYIISASSDAEYGSSYVKSCMRAMTKRGLPWEQLANTADAKSRYQTLTGQLASPNFFGYTHSQAGWADAQKAISQLRDDCLELGVSFLSGRAGTVISLETSALTGRILAVRTLQDMTIHGSQFILSAGAWASTLVDFYNSTISTAQVLGYMRLTEEEVEKLQQLPIYINFGTGWFNFPPHNETKTLQVAVHGWGYTRSPHLSEAILRKRVSSPPLKIVRERVNFVPKDGEERLREGLREILPELADRPFERLVMCWYTDTPTGDFIMDYHPDHKNLFIAGGGSGQ
jgi:sarcosine oxidase/L-pipecolate oxidase